jgi:hypothetical protein
MRNGMSAKRDRLFSTAAFASHDSSVSRGGSPCTALTARLRSPLIVFLFWAWPSASCGCLNGFQPYDSVEVLLTCRKLTGALPDHSSDMDEVHHRPNEESKVPHAVRSWTLATWLKSSNSLVEVFQSYGYRLPSEPTRLPPPQEEQRAKLSAKEKIGGEWRCLFFFWSHSTFLPPSFFHSPTRYRQFSSRLPTTR